jgi:hypothetical protein
LAKSVVLSCADQLWVADLTYIAINTGFAYVAIILDAWSRKAVGYAIGQSIDARLAIAALKTVIAPTTTRPRSSFGPWIAICGCRAPGNAGRKRHRRFNEQAGKSVRQRQGRELHENAQGRGGLPDGIRDL